MNESRQIYITHLEPIQGSEDMLLTIPPEIVESEDWRVGDVLNMEASPGRITITNKSKLDRESENPEDR
jgi:hypothetical protein